MAVDDLDLGRYKLGWADDEDYVFRPEKGLNTDVVDQMSWWKGEPEWMRELRLQVAAHLRAQADGAVVRREHARHRLPGHLLLHQAHRAVRSTSGTSCPSR